MVVLTRKEAEKELKNLISYDIKSMKKTIKEKTILLKKVHKMKNYEIEELADDKHYKFFII